MAPYPCSDPEGPFAAGTFLKLYHTPYPISSINPVGFVELLASTPFPAPAYRTDGSLIAERRFQPAGFAAPSDTRTSGCWAEDAGLRGRTGS